MLLSTCLQDRYVTFGDTVPTCIQSPLAMFHGRDVLGRVSNRLNGQLIQPYISRDMSITWAI
jgi:hypothetical protein